MNHLSSGDWTVIIFLLAVGCIAFGVILGALLVSGHRERKADYSGSHRVRRDRSALVSQEHRPGPPWGDRDGWG